MLYQLILSDAIRGLKTQPLRSLISILSMSFAVTAMILLVNLKQSAHEKINETLQTIGPNTLSAWVSQSSTLVRPITRSNIKTLQKMNHSMKIFPYLYSTIHMQTRDHEDVALPMVALDETLLSYLKLTVTQESALIQENHPYDVLVGSALAQRLNVSVRETIWVNTKGYRVSKILAPTQTNPLLDFDLNQSMFVFLTMDDYEFKPLEHFLIFYPDDMALQSAKKLFEDLIHAFYGKYTIYFRDSSLFTYEIKKTIDSIQTFLFWGAMLALVMSVAGIFSQQWLAFLERRGECGMRLSLGATKIELFNLFLAESFLIGCLGSSLGFCMGLLGLRFMLSALEWPWAFYTHISLLVSLGCVLVAMISGTIPALVAAGSRPTKLLSYQ